MHKLSTRVHRVFASVALVVAGTLCLAVLLDGCSGAKKDSPLNREINIAEQKVKADPNNLDLRVRLALLYTNDRRFGEADRALADVLKVQPTHQGALSALGNLRVEQGKFAEAITPLNQVVDANKDNPMRGASRELETVYYLLGKAYLRQGQTDAAIQNLSEALLIDRTDSDVHLLLGQVYQQQAKHQEAISQFEQAIKFVPDFAEVYEAMGTSYKALGMQNRESYAVAMVDLSNGKYEDARNRLIKVVAAEPNFAPGLLGLGLAYEKTGENDKAIEAFKKVVDLDPESFLARQRLSILGVK